MRHTSSFMRRFFGFGAFAVLTSAALLAAPAGRAEGIVDVLQHSQEQRLEQLSTLPADDPRAQAVQATFDRVLKANGVKQPIELRVISGPVWAETMLGGRVIVVNEGVAALTEGERAFIVSHEVGHVMLGHWRELGALYLKYIPDEVRPQVTEAVSGLLGREASEMSYEHELQADEFAYRSIERMGYPAETALSVFIHLPMQPDTPTHPGTRKRVAHLRSLQ